MNDPTYRAAVFLSVVWMVLPGAGAFAQAQDDITGGIDPKVQIEVEYARALTEMGLPDYAKIVIDRVKEIAPEAGPLIKVIEIQGQLALGQFDQVRAIISREADQEAESTWAMKMSMADALYAWGRYEEAQGIYLSLFKRYPDGPPKGLNSFYLASAYKYSQMLLLMGREKEALQAYENVLKAVPKDDRERRHIRRQMLSETAELLVKLAEKSSDEKEREPYFKRITELCNEILWVQDLWFGKAIVILAHVKLIQGDVDGADKLVSDYWQQLQQIDDDLRAQATELDEDLTRLSPMAECRYLLGVMLQDEAKKLMAQPDYDKEKVIGLLAGKQTKTGRSNGALQHFLNVFIKYPGTPWAPDAGQRANDVEETLQVTFGAQIKKNVTPEMMEKVEKYQFRNARALFSQNQFENAVEAYEKVLNLFPESETAVAAVGEFARCWVELTEMQKPGADLYADTVTHYLAERFSGRERYMTKAGDELLRVAELYGERAMPEKKEATTQLFFRFFPRHPLTAPLLYRGGDEKFAEGNLEGAIEYYTQVATNFPSSPLYFDAMNKIAFCQNQLDRPADEIKTLREYIARLEEKDRPGQALINASYRLASTYRKVGVDYARRDDEKYREAGNKYLATAAVKYGELVKTLSGDRSKFEDSAEDAENNQKILEGAMFNMATAYSMLSNKPEQTLQAYKLKAIEFFTAIVKQFPKSEFAPVALSQAGTLWTVLEKPDEAKTTLEQLQKDYPESPEAKNALFMLGKSLLELGRRQQAVRIFKEMFEGTGRYSDAQLLTVGLELQKAGELEIALQAFDKVLGMSQEPARIQPAMLGKARILIEEQKFAEGAQILADFVEKYPKSGYTKDVARYQSKAYAELGMREADADKRFDLFNQAVASLKRARGLTSATGDAAELDLDTARIMKLKAIAEKENGSADKAAAYRGDAVATYQTLILLADPSDPAVRAQIESAYNECLPLLLEMERWSDVVEDADRYLATFPSGRFTLDVRKWRSQANIKLVQSGQSTPVTAPAAEAEAAPAEPGT